MKKTLIALMALAGAAAADTDTTVYNPKAGTLTLGADGGEMYADKNYYAGEFSFSFEITETDLTLDGTIIIAAYYGANNPGGGYGVNAFTITGDGEGNLTLQLERADGLSNTSLSDSVTLSTPRDKSTFKASESAYELTTGSYTIDFLGGANGSAAANLILDSNVVASFTKGNHNMNGSGSDDGSADGTTLTALKFAANSNFVTGTTTFTPNIPEPTTATLSLLALAGLAARRRRK